MKINDEIEQAYREGYEAGRASAAIEGNRYRELDRVTIKGKLPSLNEYIAACRTNPHAGATMKRKVEEQIMWQIRKMKPITRPVIIFFHWHEKNRRRDKDNVAAGKKFILDAMQKAGKLVNDDNRYIKGFGDIFDYGNPDNSVTISVEVAE